MVIEWFLTKATVNIKYLLTVIQPYQPWLSDEGKERTSYLNRSHFNPFGPAVISVLTAWPKSQRRQTRKAWISFYTVYTEDDWQYLINFFCAITLEVRYIIVRNSRGKGERLMRDVRGEWQQHRRQRSTTSAPRWPSLGNKAITMATDSQTYVMSSIVRGCCWGEGMVTHQHTHTSCASDRVISAYAMSNDRFNFPDSHKKSELNPKN